MSESLPQNRLSDDELYNLDTLMVIHLPGNVYSEWLRAIAEIRCLQYDVSEALQAADNAIKQTVVLSEECDRYKLAYETCTVGGNSLASVIIGWDLPKGWQDWTYTQANDFLYNLYGNSSMAYERYEIWLCWHAIRKAIKIAEGAEPHAHNPL